MRRLRWVLAVCAASILLMSAPAHANPPGPPGSPGDWQELPPDGPCLDGGYGYDFSEPELRQWIVRHAGGWHPETWVRLGLIGHYHNLLTSPADSRAKLTAVGADYDAILAGTDSLSNEQAVMLFELDLAGAERQVRTLVPSFGRLNRIRQGVLLDMVFYRGMAELQNRPALLSALAADDFAAAGWALRDYFFWPAFGIDRISALTLMSDGYTCDPIMATGLLPPWAPPEQAGADILEYPPSDNGLGQRILAQIRAGLHGGSSGGGEQETITIRYGSGCTADMVNARRTTTIYIDCGEFAVEVQVFRP